MRKLLESDTTLRVLDETSLASDLESIKEKVETAVREAAKASRDRKSGPR
jgi:hypothetical protein